MTEIETVTDEMIDAMLDACVDIWAANIGLTAMIKNVVSISRLNLSVPKSAREEMIARQEALISDLVRNAYLEGVLRLDGSKLEAAP